MADWRGLGRGREHRGSFDRQAESTTSARLPWQSGESAFGQGRQERQALNMPFVDFGPVVRVDCGAPSGEAGLTPLAHSCAPEPGDWMTPKEFETMPLIGSGDGLLLPQPGDPFAPAERLDQVDWPAWPGPPKPETPDENGEREAAMRRLQDDMGFSYRQVQEAFKRCSTVEAMVDWILSPERDWNKGG